MRACSISCQHPFSLIWISFNNLLAHGDDGDDDDIEDEDDDGDDDDDDDDDDFDQSDQQIYTTPHQLDLKCLRLILYEGLGFYSLILYGSTCKWKES